MAAPNLIVVSRGSQFALSAAVTLTFFFRSYSSLGLDHASLIQQYFLHDEVQEYYVAS